MQNRLIDLVAATQSPAKIPYGNDDIGVLNIFRGTVIGVDNTLDCVQGHQHPEKAGQQA